MYNKIYRPLAVLSLTLIISFIGIACSKSKDINPASSPNASSTIAPNKPLGTTAVTDTTKTFTKDELAKYDGKSGNPAYVAVDGTVYDVSRVREWKNGTHNGYKAGMDLSKEVKASPHGVSVLKDIPIVGKYVG